MFNHTYIPLCDPSDQNESHVGKLNWENSKIWSSHFLLISRYYWKWVQKYVFNIFDISHLMKSIVLVFILEIFVTC